VAQQHRKCDTGCSGAWCLPSSISVCVTTPTDFVLARLILLIFPVVQPATASPWLGHLAQFQQYMHMVRSLKPLLMRPSLVLARKAVDRMWFRRHWYWPSGYIVVGIIVALLTNNIHLSSLSGILLSILAVLLWPFILGAALCRLLGFHIPGIDIT
jgi:hypothetical protein